MKQEEGGLSYDQLVPNLQVCKITLMTIFGDCREPVLQARCGSDEMGACCTQGEDTEPGEVMRAD